MALLTTVCLWSQKAGSEPLFAKSEPIPADAIALFDGNGLSKWVEQGSDKTPAWKVEKGYATAGPGNIVTRQQFGDCQLHVEFWLPLMRDARGQARANSGVYLQGSYEVQVLDSYGLNSQPNDCGAIYGVSAPLVNACRPAETWQTYDIVFHAPVFDADGKQTKNARMTVLQNGVLIQDNVEVPGPTVAAIARDIKARGPVMLQFHGNAVRYRNIWIRNL